MAFESTKFSTTSTLNGSAKPTLPARSQEIDVESSPPLVHRMAQQLTRGEPPPRNKIFVIRNLGKVPEICVVLNWLDGFAWAQQSPTENRFNHGGC